MRTCTTEKTAENQRKLCTALLEIAAKTPYEQIFVSDICQRAGISRRSFYRYFSNKDDVLVALIDGSIMECSMRAMDLRFDQKHLTALLVSFFRFWKEERCLLLEVLQKNRMENLLMRQYISWAATEVKAYPDRQPRPLAMTFSITGVMSVLFQWSLGGFETPVEQLSRETAELLERIIYLP